MRPAFGLAWRSAAAAAVLLVSTAGPAAAHVIGAAPDRPHVVRPNWQVPLRLGPRTLLLEGDVTWVPGPSPWPWALAAVAVFAAALAAAWGARRPRVLAVVAVLAVAADAVHTVGALLGSAAPLSTELNGTVTTVAGWVVAGLAAYRLFRGRTESAAIFLLLGGILLTLAGALPDLLAMRPSPARLRDDPG